MEGNPITLYKLVRTEPDWAASRIDFMNNKIAELERSRKDLIEEFAEAECMGDLAKIARNYGYVE